MGEEDVVASKLWACGTFYDGVAHVEAQSELAILEVEEEALMREIQENRGSIFHAYTIYQNHRSNRLLIIYRLHK